jgi:hypothetical protein
MKVDRVKLTPREHAETFFPGARRIAPGLWLDGFGDLHFSVPELLALVDLEDTPENREAVVEIATRCARDHGARHLVRIDPPEQA